MVKREKLSELKNILDHFPAVALLGARQTGKTTLAKEIFAKNRKSSIYLDLETQSDLAKLKDAETFLNMNQDKLIIIDEIQTLPSLFKVLRPVIDRKRKPGRFLLLGSASPELVKGVSESLAGRIAYLELPPLTLDEIPKKIKQETLWLRGGFPLSLLAKSMKQSMAWRRSFIKSYVQRDLMEIFHTSFPPVLIQNFWMMLAHANASVWNAQTFAGSLGISSVTVKRYLNFLEAAFLVRQLSPWYVNISKRIVKNPKIYIRDTGLLHALLDIDNQNSLYGHPVCGASWEGFVIEQIIQNLPENVRPFYYRTHHGAEADLVLVKGIKPVAIIDIKVSNAPVISKGFYQVMEDLNLKSGYVITPSSDTYSQKKIKVTSLMNFLREGIKLIK